jgi:hypothetical protein
VLYERRATLRNNIFSNIYVRLFIKFSDEKSTTIQSVPIIFPINEELNENIKDKKYIILTSYINNEPIAIIENPSSYTFR